MRAKDKSLRAIENLFRRRRVVELSDLYETIQTDSRMTVFRRLKGLNYLSSYTHAGRYYTLYEIPLFGRDGLWHYRDVGFSQYGSLKNTVIRLVNMSEAGMTHLELQKKFRVRVHNTLLDLVSSEQISRERVEKQFLYTNIEPKRAKKQIGRRRKLKIGVVTFGEQLPEWVVIEVLVEAIRGTARKLNALEVTSRLRERGMMVTGDHVESIFKHYNLKKTLDSEW